jgi:hypothetical protein
MSSPHLIRLGAINHTHGHQQSPTCSLGLGDSASSSDKSTTVDQGLVGRPRSGAGLRASSDGGERSGGPLPILLLTHWLTIWPARALSFANAPGDLSRRSNFATIWRGSPNGSDSSRRAPTICATTVPGSCSGTQSPSRRFRTGSGENAAEALHTESHLGPDSGDRTRVAVHHVLHPAEYL